MTEIRDVLTTKGFNVEIEVNVILINYMSIIVREAQCPKRLFIKLNFDAIISDLTGFV